MHRSIPAFVMTAVAAVPAGSALLASTHAVSASSPHKATTYKFKGPIEDMQWGPVQVIVSIKKKKITGIKATAPTERTRSAFINGEALPLLKQEVLQAQNANVDLISGATMTSEAYIQSLQAALDKAHKKHKF